MAVQCSHNAATVLIIQRLQRGSKHSKAATVARAWRSAAASASAASRSSVSMDGSTSASISVSAQVR